MRACVLILVLLSSAVQALNQGELQFTLGDKKYATLNAVGHIDIKKGRSRIMVAVKDVSAKFMLVLTADVPSGDELKPLRLTTEDSSLTVSLRTMQGSMAILPHQQLALSAHQLYTERVQVETEELEEIPEQFGAGLKGNQSHHRPEKKYRKKIRSEYRKVLPKWHAMSRKERLATGEGIIENGTFRDTFLSVQLVPVVSGGKVVSYEGSFSGNGRFSKSISGAEQKPIHSGLFNVKVHNAP